METIQEELSSIPLSEVKKIQDKLGLKAFQKIRHGMNSKSNRQSNQVFKRENKNRPTELSARRPVPSKCENTKKITRDPRFDDLSGEFNERIFKHTYSFMKDVKSREKVKLKKIISKTKDKEKKSEFKQLFNRLEQQEIAEKRKARREELERELKKKERERVKEGKAPYFLKKSEKKAIIEADYQKELEKSGKIQKYAARKTKKLSMKEKKKKSWTTKDVDIPL